MVVRCPACQTAYRLEAMRVPETGVRVRCPRCAHVFRMQMPAVTPPPAPSGEALPGIERDLREPPRLRPSGATRRTGESQHVARAPLPAWQAEPERTLALEPATPKGPPPRLETAPFRPTVDSEPTVATTAPAAPTPGAAQPAVQGPTGPAHDRARRLARVLVSDILVYNQPLRDRAQSEGRLAAALGPEIGKAWELYKSKVSPEVVANTTYFKDALNEILAGGEKIF